MKVSERDDVLFSLIREYVLCKYQDHIWQRDSSRSALLSEGKLLGFLLAHEMSMVETLNIIEIFHNKSQRIVMQFNKPTLNPRENTEKPLYSSHIQKRMEVFMAPA